MTDARYLRTREAVFAAVREVLVAEGPAGLTAERIAEASGVGRSTVYRNWPDLGALACEVFDELMHHEPLPETGDPSAALLAYLRDYARRLNDPQYVAVLLALMEAAARDEAFADVQRRMFSQTRSRAGAIIEAGKAAGLLDGDVDVRQGVEDVVAPFLYRRLVSQQAITPRMVTELHERLLAQWAPSRDRQRAVR